MPEATSTPGGTNRFQASIGPGGGCERRGRGSEPVDVADSCTCGTSAVTEAVLGGGTEGTRSGLGARLGAGGGVLVGFTAGIPPLLGLRTPIGAVPLLGADADDSSTARADAGTG
jgi:hypothetical protein